MSKQYLLALHDKLFEEEKLKRHYSPEDFEAFCDEVERITGLKIRDGQNHLIGKYRDIYLAAVNYVE